jgi:hypothetical protein
MELKFEAIESVSLKDVFPNSYVVPVAGIPQLYQTSKSVFWKPTKFSIFHKQILALLFESGWCLVVDSLRDESDLTAVGEVLFTHPENEGFIGMDINYPDEVSLGEEGDQTELLSVVTDYITALAE